jgi:hypothetical protein
MGRPKPHVTMRQTIALGPVAASGGGPNKKTAGKPMADVLDLAGRLKVTSCLVLTEARNGGD